MQLGLSLSTTSAAILNRGVPETITINGVRGRLLRGNDNQPLKGSDGQYLYGAA